jgi:ABC-type polysaccharide/polyol phosphate export permease
VPASTVAANLVHLVVALACLMVVLVVTGRAPWLDLHWLVLAVAMETALCLGVAFALSVWNVRLRDIGQLMAIFVVVLFFATPVVYELSQVPDGYRPLVLANPLTMIMETYRTALFERPGPPAGELLLAVGEIVLILGLGYLAFARRSRELVKDL